MKRREPVADDPAAARGPRWVTLSNHRRVLLDEEGRIVRGLPELFHRVDVRDVSALGARVRETQRDEVACERSVRRRHPRTFRSAEDAVRALLEVNPHLLDFVEVECSYRCDEYRTWVRRGRRGPKPAPTRDGRFDAIEVPLDLKGKRRISSWLEAVFVTVPPSRRWDDFHARLQYLADATGLRLALPEPAEQLNLEESEIDHCQSTASQRIQQLVELARAARFPGADTPDDSDEEVPF
jgi:hypothetical protein